MAGSAFGPRAPRSENVRSAPTRSPLGIKVICLGGWFTSLLMIYYNSPLLGSGGLPAVTGGLFIVGAVIQMVGFYGLWTCAFWGWVIVLGMYLVGILLAVITMNGWGIVVQGLLAYYVYRKHEYYL